ncbi:signal transduction histidine kinase [Sphingomonas sp. SORGH_AS 950]|uniref:sensor histidine kinase n=1 Tax=Sphingomonas sp. SORGH_AS_0950 TaxID=3041792 RepID=UPI00277F4090|nr:ATP-binding protein [Sphingomonas sp. SORGH_AS_0950]MDQ1158534.1 signal transduction histidine kinase [Sphingomonas sp. SORGH_AS_0950]
MTEKILVEGTIPFSIEARILRELGERLVKEPEVAILELIKNAYDADASNCSISHDYPNQIVVQDDGVGMTFERFRDGWMRIGTSSKEGDSLTAQYGRRITGEKGIGRFAVRFLGMTLTLDSVCDDPERGVRTRLRATFDWASFDRHQDLGKTEVDFVVTQVGNDVPTGTMLTIGALRPSSRHIRWKDIGTGSVNVVSAARALPPPPDWQQLDRRSTRDPGFSIRLKVVEEDGEIDLSGEILEHYVLRAVLRLDGTALELKVYKGGGDEPFVSVTDEYVNDIGRVYADIRFFPRRPGTFEGALVDGRKAYNWVRSNSGVLVFDRGFQVRPYGVEGDDWLSLVADAARNRRDPESTISKHHFGMTKAVAAAPSENWMLRLPESAQLIGAVHVEGARSSVTDDSGLHAAADREGFVINNAFLQLKDIVRGAVEAIAYADRRLQQAQADEKAAAELLKSRGETQQAIEEIEADPNLSRPQKNRIVAMLVESQERVEQADDHNKEKQKQLEIMSLLGVIAGFMTHEFGVAIGSLKEAQAELDNVAKELPQFADRAKAFRRHATTLQNFVSYSRAYVEGAKIKPTKPYRSIPRLRQVVKVFGDYARDRDIEVEIGVEPEVMVPLIPAALYNGIAQNLFTNALKAVTAKDGGEKRIAFRAWNDKGYHHLQVSDSGVGIPSPVKAKIFDPLFTTTESRNDPLGSGMGLGLALVQRGAEAFGGKAQLVAPPPGFTTCMEVRFPLDS